MTPAPSSCRLSRLVDRLDRVNEWIGRVVAWLGLTLTLTVSA